MTSKQPTQDFSDTPVSPHYVELLLMVTITIIIILSGNGGFNISFKAPLINTLISDT